MALHHMLRAAAGNAGPSDPYFYDVTLLLTGDGTNGAQNNTFLDSSTNNFTITRNGNTTQGTFSPYGNLWSNYFDGSGDYLSTPDNAAFDFGTGAFAIECWFNLTADAARDGAGTGVRNAELISAFPTSGAPQTNTWNLEIYGDVNVTGTAIAFGTNNSSGVSTAKTYTLPSTLQKNTWHHIVVCRSGTNFAMFYDGVRVISDAAFGNDINNGGWLVRVGALGFNTYERYFPGYISNMRVVKGSAVYDPTASTITVPTTPLTAVSGTSLLTCQSNRFIDNSSNNFTLTVNGNTSVQRFSPFNPTAPYSATTIGGSGYFDGTGDYLTVGSAANWTFLNNGSDWTVEFDVFHSSTSEISIATTTTTASQIGVAIILNYSSNAVGVQFYRGVSGSYATFISSAYLQINQWNHVAITFANSGKTCSFYINGVAAGSSSNTGFAYSSSNPAYTLTVAAAANNPSITLLTGYLANLRISDNVRTGLTTLPTAPYTSDANTKLLCNFTNAGIPDAAMMNDLETVGNAQVSTSVKKYGTGSLAFDGTGDYLKFLTPQTFYFGTGDFTVEAWVYFNNVSTYQTIIGDINTTTTGNAVWATYYYAGGTKTLRFVVGAAVNYSFAWTPSTNTWYHVAISRASGSLKAFIDGIQIGTTQTSTDNINSTYSTGNFYIGESSTGDQQLNGYIDDLRITKGYARYTSNFTPPTAALPVY